MRELNIDPKAPDFTEEKMIARFQEMVDDKKVHFF